MELVICPSKTVSAPFGNRRVGPLKSPTISIYIYIIYNNIYIYRAYFSGLNFRGYPGYPSKIWPEIWYSTVPPSVGSWRSPIESVKPPAFKFQNLIRSLSGLYHHVYTKRSYDEYHINTRIKLILYLSYLVGGRYTTNQ